MVKAKKVENVEIPRLQRTVFKVTLYGISDLIQEKFSDKTKRMMAEKHAGKDDKAKGREKKDHIADCVNAMHIMGDNGDANKVIAKMKKAKVKAGDNVAKHLKGVRVGFPAIAFKKAAIQGCRGAKMTMEDAKRAFFINGITDQDMVEIKFKKCILREDAVRNSNGQPDIRYRPGFVDWTAEVEADVNTEMLSAGSLISLLERGGYGSGIAGGRPGAPRSTGPFGRFGVKES